MIRAIVFLYGLVFGSFYNVVIYRIPRDLSIARGRSFCPACERPLSSRDLVPVFSWLFLKGRCRTCGAPISRRYPLVEWATGVLFLVAFHHGEGIIGFLHLALLFSLLFITALIDHDHKIIADRVLLFFALAGASTGAGHLGISSMIWGGLTGFGLYLLIFLIARAIYGEEVFGFGDVLFMATIGLYLGWPLTLLAGIGAFYVALVLVIVKKFTGGAVGRKMEIPFAPAMATAAFLTALYGHDVLYWYIKTFL